MKRARKKKGIAIIIALFTVFAILTLGVTYIGLSLSNSKATSGHEKEALIINFANAGIDFALNYMGTPTNWEASTNLLAAAESTGNKPKVRVISGGSTSNDEFASYWTDLGGASLARIIETDIGSLETVGIQGTPNLLGHWRILVIPEGSPTATHFNTNFRIIVRARILNTPVEDAEFYKNAALVSHIVASREVMARTSNEFPGSIYKNIRSYDACGGFHYPNYQECTADAVFAAEDFNWDGQIRVDGTTNDNKRGRPQKTSNFVDGYSGTDGWADDGNLVNSGGNTVHAKDTSGSINTLILDPQYTETTPQARDHWPKFNGKATVKQDGNAFAEPFSGDHSKANGIHYASSGMETNRLDVFTNTKDPFYTNAQPLDTMDTIWSVGDRAKLSDPDHPTNTPYLEEIAAEDGAVIDVSDDALRPDPFSAFAGAEPPMIRICILPYVSNGTEYNRYYVQRCYRDATPGNATFGEWVPQGPATTYTNNPSDANFLENNLIYVKGGNVQVFGGKANIVPASGMSFSGLATDGDPGDNDGNYGHLTAPLTIVADSNASRDSRQQSAVETRYPSGGGTVDWTPALGAAEDNGSRGYDAWLNTVNIWDKQANDGQGGYVYQCYENGKRVFPAQGQTNGVVNNRPIWTDTNETVQAYLSDPERFTVRYPPTPADINQQPEGNLSVIGDLVQRKGIEPPSLGLVAKNHVLLNDYHMPQRGSSGFVDPDPDNNGQINSSFNIDDLDETGRQVLDLTATVGSQNHSMQMDFFNLNANTIGKPGTSNNLGNDLNNNKYHGSYAPPGKDALYRNFPCEDGNQGPDNKFINKYATMPPHARTQLWWDFNYGADQTTGTVGGSPCHNYNTLYQAGKFRFVGSIISLFADVEADAKGTDPNYGNAHVPGLGYIFQSLSYDANLTNRSAPWISTSCYSKRSAKDVIYWQILSYVDKGALSEMRNF